MAGISDPFYPYSFSYLHGEWSAHVEIVPCWRALLPSKIGLEHSLRKLPPEFVKALLKQNRDARNCQERGDWENAEERFLKCKAMLLEEKVDGLLEKRTYDFLLAWADLPLAQLYQSRGGAHMLEEAMDLRKEILDYVMPLQSSHSLLVEVCKTYYHTARYEWAELISSEAKDEAVRDYAESQMCTRDKAEAQLCLLLGVDHEYLGSFEVGLQWIQEAKRLWEKIEGDVNGFDHYVIDCEAKLLMRLGKFPDAVDVLEDIRTFLGNSSPKREYLLGQVHSEVILEVHKMLEECYKQISSEFAGKRDSEQANHYEELAKLQSAIQCSLDAKNKLTSFGTGIAEIQDSHKILTPTAAYVGSSLGLVGDGAVEVEVGKLPRPIIKVIQSLLLSNASTRIIAPHDEHIRERCTHYNEQIREALKVSKLLVDKKTYNWILSFYDLGLVELYQFTLRKHQEAVEIWSEMIEFLEEATGSEYIYLTKGLKMMHNAAMYELHDQSFGLGVIDHQRDPQEHSHSKINDSSHWLDSNQCCFWLYFGHSRSSKWEDGLKWVREAKRLREEYSTKFRYNVGIPNIKQCSTDDYFCCEFHYMRCEVDLLMKLGKYEDAMTLLDIMLKTRHFEQGSQVLAENVNGWIAYCTHKQMLNISASSDYDTEFANQLATALLTSLKPDNNELRDKVAEQSPSPIGCTIDSNAQRLKLVQSEAGFEHHLLKFNVEFQMAIRKHGNKGRFHLKRGEWEESIFEFEWCMEILKFIVFSFINSKSSQGIIQACDWLMMWACTPLVDIYQFKTMQFKKAFDLRVEMVRIVEKVKSLNENSNEVQYVLAAVTTTFYMSLYAYSISAYPESKNGVIKSMAMQVEFSNHLSDFGAGKSTGLQTFKDEWETEDSLLMNLGRTYMAYGSYETALHYAQQAKKLFEQQFPGSEHYPEKSKYVFLEARCLWYLHRSDDARTILKAYWDSTGLQKSKLPKEIQIALIAFGKDMGALNSSENFKTLEYINERAHVSAEDFEEIWCLRQQSLQFEKKKEYAEAIEREKLCGEVIHKVYNGKMELAIEDQQLVYHYGHLGELYAKNFKSSLSASLSSISSAPSSSPSSSSSTSSFPTVCLSDLSKTIRENVDFISAKQCFEKVNEVSSILQDSQIMAHTNFLLAHLYDSLEFLHMKYLKFIINQISDANTIWSHMKEIELIGAYLFTESPIQEYGERAVIGYASLLDNMAESKRYSEGWIEWLEQHKTLYAILQNHYSNKALWLSLFSSTPENEKNLQLYKWTAFMYAEEERSRLMLYQLKSHRLNSHKYWHYKALETTQENCATFLKGDTVYIQYSPSILEGIYNIYIIKQGQELHVEESDIQPTRGNHIFTQKNGEPTQGIQPTFERVLEDLYSYLEPGGKSKNKSLVYNVHSMNNVLEFLYDVLIRPIAHYIDKMKPDDKLIVSPSQLLTKVPFAALRDSKGQNYLIERHTIVLTPSLKVLQFCSERLQSLQNSQTCLGYGSIVALGDPLYNACAECIKHRRQRLEGTGKEVEYIARLFGEETVVKLLQDHATAEQLLHWVSRPSSHESFRQAVVHIGAHGVINEKDHEKSVLQLACPPNSASGAKLSTSDVASTSRGGLQDDDYSDEGENDSDDGDEIDVKMKSMFVSDRFKQPMESMSTHTCSHFTPQDASSSEANIGRGTGSSMQSDNPHDLRVEDMSFSQVEWRAELVVLSACRTSRGRITVEGVLSLARSFITAGVPCVVASLWNVDDDATSTLMKVFYDKLQQGSNVSSALRYAMLHLLRLSPDTVGKWAPFNVWGMPTLQIAKQLQQEPNISL